MTSFFDYIQRLVLMILVVQVAMMLAPDGEMKGYVRFVCGLIIVSVIISPVVQIIPSLEEDIGALDSEQIGFDSDYSDDMADQGRKQTEELTALLFQDRASVELESEIDSLPEVREAGLYSLVTLEADTSTGQIKSIDVLLSKDENTVDDEADEQSLIRIDTIVVSSETEKKDTDHEDAEILSESLRSTVVTHISERHGVSDKKVEVYIKEENGQ